VAWNRSDAVLRNNAAICAVLEVFVGVLIATGIPGSTGGDPGGSLPPTAPNTDPTVLVSKKVDYMAM